VARNSRQFEGEERKEKAAFIFSQEKKKGTFDIHSPLMQERKRKKKDLYAARLLEPKGGGEERKVSTGRYQRERAAWPPPWGREGKGGRLARRPRGKKKKARRAPITMPGASTTRGTRRQSGFVLVAEKRKKEGGEK